MDKSFCKLRGHIQRMCSAVFLQTYWPMSVCLALIAVDLLNSCANLSGGAHYFALLLAWGNIINPVISTFLNRLIILFSSVLAWGWACCTLLSTWCDWFHISTTEDHSQDKRGCFAVMFSTTVRILLWIAALLCKHAYFVSTYRKPSALCHLLRAASIAGVQLPIIKVLARKYY